MNPKPELKTSEQWQSMDKHKNLLIYDPDGWRDGECDFKKDQITEEEFEKRKMQCTLTWSTK